MLLDLIRKEDPVYRAIQEHCKGSKNHHVEAARKMLNTHRLGPDIERDMSKLLELISELEVAQKMEMPESQKFRVLRVLMAHEERVHMKNVVGIASYNKENFNFTIKKIREEWDALPADKIEVQIAAAPESTTTDRICFKFKTNECTRKGCPHIHKLMTDQEKRDQKYSTKRPAVKEKNINNKFYKKPNGEKKLKGKKDTRNNNSQGTNGMHNNMPLTREHQFQTGETICQRPERIQQETTNYFELPH